MITELFGQGGPGGRVKVVVGCCRSGIKWFLPRRRLGCHVRACPSVPSGADLRHRAGTLRLFWQPHHSDAFPNKLWEKTPLLSAAQAKRLGPPALSLVSLLKLCEHRLEEKPPWAQPPRPLSIAELQGMVSPGTKA